MTIQHLPKISLVPALTLRSPLPGGTLAPDGALSWQPYPGAAYYSITVLSLTEPPSAGRPRDTATCWSRTAVAANRTPIDRQHFINGHTRLQPGGTYMWVVYAHARDGRMLSSSEHYFELGEPTFTVARPRHQAGRPAAPSVDRSPSLARDAAGPHSLENATRFRSRRGLYAAIPKEEGL